MLNMKYALEKGGPKRLEIVWQTNHTEFYIKLDGKEIAAYHTPEPLLAGEELSLDDGSTLKIQLHSRSKYSSFIVSRNGLLLSPKMPSPAERLKSTCQILYIIAALNIIGGLSSFMPSVRFHLMPQNSWLLLPIGLIILALAFLVRKNSKTALYIIVTIFAIDSAAFLFYTSIPLLGRILIFIVRLFLLLGMLVGFGAIEELKAQNNADKDVQSA